MIPGWKQTPSRTIVSVLVNWRSNGEIKAYFPCDIPRNAQLNHTVAPPRRPGLYRITIEQDDEGPLIYVGEAELLPSRLWAYTHLLHEDKPESTSARLAAEIRTAACAERRTTVDIATTGKMALRGEEIDLRMAIKAHRLLAEAAAVLDEEWKHGTDAYVLNKALDDGLRWIAPPPPLDEPVLRRRGPQSAC
ncbi:hypothetical protein E1287_24470 [Actinomadura sp. KC06]|uniref:hypothetical protein n=1 Tax=Actinomadura sp. KC06 TaxID=2530369 RepID=UPI00104F66AD|nr:hypothetical protein [Actinomadura sp. KC06]TDD32020.1 hypothetical protein E1287_24470 [Actinomadura sp. KC06]